MEKLRLLLCKRKISHFKTLTCWLMVLYKKQKETWEKGYFLIDNRYLIISTNTIAARIKIKTPAIKIS